MNTTRSRWKVLGVVLIGVLIGVVGVAATNSMVHATSTTEFCSTACHSMQWVAKAHERGPHGKTRTGVVAGCSDCHIPYEAGHADAFQYVALLTHKAKAGIHDVIAESRGIISTEAKWNAERERLSAGVKEFMANNNSLVCRSCHDVTKMAKKETAEMHAPLAQMDKVVCIECHANAGHVYEQAAAAPAQSALPPPAK
jgi:nitrate/TMAO reductase-like tetraheme cytochrome c subunit